MGCDIHGFLQKRWSNDEPYRNVCRVPEGRNYTLFALLADVRNYDSVRPFQSEENGTLRRLPDDLAHLNDDRPDDYATNPNWYFTDVGEHSQTWMTVAELLTWDGWDQTVQRKRLVERAEYERCVREGDTPKEYCGDAWGSGIVKVNHAQVIDGTASANWTYVWYDWPVKVRSECEHFLKWLEWNVAEHCYGDDKGENLRLVIGFDS